MERPQLLVSGHRPEGRCCNSLFTRSAWQYFILQKDSGGRLLSILISFQNLHVNLVNVYAPTYPTKRKMFFQSIRPFIFPNSCLVIAGDLYSYDSLLDKMGGSASIDVYFSELKSVNFLCDACRLKHPREKQVTWFNCNLSISSRLDTFLISRHLCGWVISCKIGPCVYSDHEFVFLELNLHSTPQWGPGFWKFNNSLLRDEKFCSSISDLIELFLRFRSSFPSSIFLSVFHFWEKLAEPLVAVFNQSLEHCELPETMKASITRLIHKKDDQRLLKNWRPTSLLNIDYKICSKAVSLWLARVLGSIIQIKPVQFLADLSYLTLFC